jgi:hypothetical protein
MLTAHITFSVGWLGAVAVFLAHSIAGLYSDNTMIVRAAYLAMNLSAWLIIVPACFGALLTGVVQSVGTQWGLFKHYWIVVKLLLTVSATILLLVHMQPISFMAGIVSEGPLTTTEHRGVQIQLIVDAGLALLVLLATTTISVYKPWGMTGYGVSTLRKNVKKPLTKSKGRYIVIAFILLVIVFVIVHLLGGGLHGH